MSEEGKKETEQEPVPAEPSSPGFDGCAGCHNEGPQCMGCISAPRNGINFW